MDHDHSLQKSLEISEADIAGSKSSFPEEKWEPSIPLISNYEILFDFTVNVHGPC